LNCELVDQEDLVQRYLAKRLSEQDEEAFESHFLTCARCQQELELGLAARALLPRSRRPARWGVWAGLAGLAAAAAVASVLLLPSRGAETLRALGAVRQAPLYLGVPIRGGIPSAADSLFAAGMTQYIAEQYDRAAGELDKALHAGADAAPTEF